MQLELKLQTTSKDGQEEQSSVLKSVVYNFYPRRSKAPPFAVIDLGSCPCACIAVPDGLPVTLLCKAQQMQRFKMLPVEDLKANCSFRFFFRVALVWCIFFIKIGCGPMGHDQKKIGCAASWALGPLPYLENLEHPCVRLPEGNAGGELGEV